MRSEREGNYDLLRVLSMIAVIVIHTSFYWVSPYSSFVYLGGDLSTLPHPLAACIYNSLSRFAVPCFVMLSGAFLLANDKNAEYFYFYRKSFQKLGIPTILFILLYAVYRVMLCFIGETIRPEEFLQILSDTLIGYPMLHMWYLYMLFGLYLMIPIIIRFKNSIAEVTFDKVSVVFWILACLSWWTTQNFRTAWNIGQTFEYAGYLMLGYVLRKNARKNTLRGILLITLGIALELAAAYLEYQYQIVRGLSGINLQYQIVEPYSPLIALASVSIFKGFSMLTIPSSKLLSYLSGASFLVYLFHVGVLDLLNKPMFMVFGSEYYLRLNCIVWIPLLTVITLLLSLLLTAVFNHIYPKLFSFGQQLSA